MMKSEHTIRKYTLPFTTVTKIISCLPINLWECMQDIYKQFYNTFLKTIKDNGKIHDTHGYKISIS